jgi:hypothetical protein
MPKASVLPLRYLQLLDILSDGKWHPINSIRVEWMKRAKCALPVGGIHTTFRRMEQRRLVTPRKVGFLNAYRITPIGSSALIKAKASLTSFFVEPS